MLEIKSSCPGPRLAAVQFYNATRPYEVRQGIDTNTAKLKHSEAKFYLVNMSPSQKELQHIGNDPRKLNEDDHSVMAENADNFQKGLGPDNVKWYGKLEYQ